MSRPARRIDAHQHFWQYTPEVYGWIRSEVIRRDFMPDDLSPLLARAGFDGTVAVQARQTFEESIWLLALADRFPFIAGVVGWVDFTAADVDAQIAALSAHRRFRGVRCSIQSALDLEEAPRFEFTRGIQALTECDLAFDLLIRPEQLGMAARIARIFPAQRFVLDHIANPPIRERRLEPWATDLRALAENPNVACKVSGMVTNADRAAWRQEDFVPFLDVVFEAFGADRLLIGSDWPVCLQAGAYGAVMQIVSDYVAEMDQSAQDAILGGNAITWYRLPG